MLGLSVFIDIYLAVYPAAVLSKLQLNNKKKIALSCTLGLGFMSVARLNPATLYHRTDVTSADPQLSQPIKSQDCQRF